MKGSKITDTQRRQYRQLIEDAANRALIDSGIDGNTLQNFIRDGGVTRSRITSGIRSIFPNNQFSDEEINSNCGYPMEYKIRPIMEQVEILRERLSFKGCSINEKIISRSLPEGAEGWFVIPNWEKSGMRNYQGAAGRMPDSLINYGYCDFNADFFRRHILTEKALRFIYQQQREFDFLIIPAQFGLRHKGKSVRHARETFFSGEFGLGVYEVGCMILTHPEREFDKEQIHIDCAGDEYNMKATRTFSGTISLGTCGERKLVCDVRAYDIYSTDPLIIPNDMRLRSSGLVSIDVRDGRGKRIYYYDHKSDKLYEDLPRLINISLEYDSRVSEYYGSATGFLME